MPLGCNLNMGYISDKLREWPEGQLKKTSTGISMSCKALVTRALRFSIEYKYSHSRCLKVIQTSSIATKLHFVRIQQELAFL